MLHRRDLHTASAHRKLSFEMASVRDGVKRLAEAVPTEETQERKDQRFRKLYITPPDFKEIAALDAEFATV